MLLLTLGLTVALMQPSLEAQNFPRGNSDEEARAVGALKSINTAEGAYQNACSTGYSRTLAALGMGKGWKNPSASAAGLIDETLTTGKLGGYGFAYKAGAPDSMGRSGTVYGHGAAASMASRRAELLRGPVGSDPLDVAKPAGHDARSRDLSERHKGGVPCPASRC
jgi:hypothetical protein